MPRKRKVAASSGTSPKSVIRTAVDAEMGAKAKKAGGRVKFPLLPSNKPGALNLTNAEIEVLLA